MWEAIGGIFSWLGGEGIGASIARIAIGLGVSKLLNKTNDSAATTTSASTVQGTRQQISPATDNKLPVAYGDSYFGGTIVDVQLTNSNKEMFAVIDLCEITGDLFSSSPDVPANRVASSITIDGVYLNNQKITFKADGTTIDYTTDDTGVVDTNASGLASICLYGGSSNQPMLPCQTGTTTPIAGTVPPVAYEVMPGWNNTYTNQNKVFAVVKVNYDPSKGLHTIPTLKFHVRNTMNKPGDVIHDYMSNSLYGCGINSAQIDPYSILALNNYADQLVTLGIYPAQPRYRINGLVRTTETVFSNLQKLAAAGGAFVSFDISIGRWAVVPNKATAKTRDFTDSNILGQIAINTSNMDQFYNKVEVQFPYKVLRDQYNYVRFDLPEIYRNANEMDNQLQITHEFVNDVVQSTILANLDLRQSRENQVITFKTDYSEYGLAIGDVFGVTTDEYGWSGKLFRAIRIRRNESDTGQLTVEITGQTYNADVYTVEDITDFVPLIGVGHSVPSITPIQQPDAPLVSSQTLSSQPSVSITGVVPVGLVSLMEFWYTTDTNPNDDERAYTSLGTMRPEDGGIYTTGVSVTFKTVLLSTATYYFKVTAANPGANSESRFSPPSIPLAYVYTQAPDVLKYSTPSVDDSGNDPAAEAGGMSVALMAAYAATKLNWFGANGILSGNATMSSIFGLSDAQSKQVNNSVAADKAGQLTPDQITQIANDAAKAQAETTTNQILANTVIGGSNVIVMESSTLTGKVFPMVFGSGPKHGEVDSRAGIFTHDHLVFGGGAAAMEMKGNNIITSPVTLSATLNGSYQAFYNIPSLTDGSWSQKPVYDETLTDKYAADTKVTLYYSEATYAGGSLDSQSWSAWKKLAADNGVTGSDPVNEPIKIWTNPPPTDQPKAPYIVEEIKQVDGVGNDALSSMTSAYDPFKPNVEKIIGYKVSEGNKGKSLTVTIPGSKAYDGTKLVIFGASVFNLPDGTPFNNNTVFGHQDEEYVVNYSDARSFRQIANNGSMFVGIDAAIDKVFFSTDGLGWKPVFYDEDVTHEEPSWINLNDPSNPDAQIMPKFRFVVHDGSKFIAYAGEKNVATSTDGKSWTEPVSTKGLENTIQFVIADSGHYLAVGLYGIQTSADGITWSSMSLPETMGSRGPTCGVWDGSKFIVGNRRTGNQGFAMWSSADGSSWSEVVGVSDTSWNSRVSADDNAAVSYQVSLQNDVVESALP